MKITKPAKKKFRMYLEQFSEVNNKKASAKVPVSFDPRPPEIS